MTRWAWLAWGLFVIGVGGAAGHGQAVDDASFEVKTQVDAAKVQIEVERDGDGRKDELKIEFDTGKAEFFLEYESQALGADSQQKLHATFEQLVEFEDENGNGAYDPSEVVVQTVDLSGNTHRHVEGPVSGVVDWDPLAADETTDEEGAAGRVVRATGRLGDGTGQFGITVYTFDTTASVAGEVVTPTEVKFDILISAFPYRSDTSALALVLSTKLESEFDARGGDAEGGAVEGVVAGGAVGNQTVQLVLTWRDTASVDGADGPVRTTVISSKVDSTSTGNASDLQAEEVFALGYPRGEEILHDPLIGVHYDSSRPTPPAGIFPFVVALAVAAAVLARRR